MSVLWATAGPTARGPHSGRYNHKTGTTHFLPDLIDKFANPYWFRLATKIALIVGARYGVVALFSYVMVGLSWVAIKPALVAVAVLLLLRRNIDSLWKGFQDAVGRLK